MNDIFFISISQTVKNLQCNNIAPARNTSVLSPGSLSASSQNSGNMGSMSIIVIGLLSVCQEIRKSADAVFEIYMAPNASI